MADLNLVADALMARGYEAKVCSRDEAISLVLAAAADAVSIGWGGSETVKELGLRERITALGKEIRDHRADCDVFLLSANALLEDGRIVNIDGTGNRIAASIFGPKRVIYLVGRNKLVTGGIDDAVARIRAKACPPNAKRLGRRTPCGLAGACCDPVKGCSSPDRMCKVTAVFDAPPTHTPTTVLILDEDLGY